MGCAHPLCLEGEFLGHVVAKADDIRHRSRIVLDREGPQVPESPVAVRDPCALRLTGDEASADRTLAAGLREVMPQRVAMLAGELGKVTLKVSRGASVGPQHLQVGTEKGDAVGYGVEERVELDGETLVTGLALLQGLLREPAFRRIAGVDDDDQFSLIVRDRLADGLEDAVRP